MLSPCLAQTQIGAEQAIFVKAQKLPLAISIVIVPQLMLELAAPYYCALARVCWYGRWANTQPDGQQPAYAQWTQPPDPHTVTHMGIGRRQVLHRVSSTSERV